MKEEEIFSKLKEVNVTGYVEEKNGLKYLSWAYAWQKIMELYPQATYEIERFDNKPYLYDEKTGYMVFTKMNINDIEREMWLPVMDSNNKAMLDHKYNYKVKDYKTNNYKEKEVETATMFDINKTIMRCLVKNLAMYGLGLALYSGEDLPEEELTEEQLKERANKYIFTKGKHVDKSILEIYKEDPKYLQWCLDNGKNEEVKSYIEILTDLKRTEIPDTDEDQKEKLEMINKLNTISDEQRESIFEKYNVSSSSELTLSQLREIFI